MAPVGMVLGLTGALVQGYMIERVPFLGNAALQTILVGLRSIADIIFGNIPILFAMGVAYGVTKKDKGSAVFSSIITYLILNTPINVLFKLKGNLSPEHEMDKGGKSIVYGI